LPRLLHILFNLSGNGKRLIIIYAILKAKVVLYQMLCGPPIRIFNISKS
ncbi:unnamed protein product, partial [Callosobruchus maculatus]